MKAIGVVLQLVGAGITIYGLIESRNELFPEQQKLRRAAARVLGVVRASWVAFRRLIGRPPPQSQTVRAPTATINITDEADTMLAIGSPPPGSSVQDVVHWAERCLEQLRGADRRIEQQAQQTLDRLEVLQHSVAAMEGTLREEMRTSVGGREGRGLTLAWLGVAVGAAGTLVGAFAR